MIDCNMHMRSSPGSANPTRSVSLAATSEIWVRVFRVKSVSQIHARTHRKPWTLSQIAPRLHVDTMCAMFGTIIYITTIGGDLSGHT